MLEESLTKPFRFRHTEIVSTVGKRFEKRLCLIAVYALERGNEFSDDVLTARVYDLFDIPGLRL